VWEYVPIVIYIVAVKSSSCICMTAISDYSYNLWFLTKNVDCSCQLCISVYSTKDNDIFSILESQEATVCKLSTIFLNALFGVLLSRLYWLWHCSASTMTFWKNGIRINLLDLSFPWETWPIWFCACSFQTRFWPKVILVHISCGSSKKSTSSVSRSPLAASS